jgi:XTP/dITP diphosphohydrolase
MLNLLIATNSPHKLAEYRAILADLPVQLTSPSEEGLELSPDESGITFEENAIIKARAFAAASGLPSLADDSGLEVDALNGEPGIFSARYGGTSRFDQEGRYNLVLQKMADVPWEARTARFRCAIAIATPATELVGVVDGRVEGYISYEPRGMNGFGYDPVFYVSEFGKTLAEMTAEQKHKISHRGRAARAAIPLIKQLLTN